MHINRRVPQDITTVVGDESKAEEERILRSWLVVRVMSVDVELLNVKGPPYAARRVFESDLFASRRDVTFLLSFSFGYQGWARFIPLGNGDLPFSHPLFSFNSHLPTVKWSCRGKTSPSVSLALSKRILCQLRKQFNDRIHDIVACPKKEIWVALYTL